jgi:uncharacterized protein DUF5318
VRTQRQVVDYALQRRALLADVRAGRVGLAAVCDADPYLKRAARYHGEETTRSCPLCREERLVQVSWVFGESLGAASGSARKPDELDEMAARLADFTVHVVEVCGTCGWNHLVLSYVLGTGSPERRRTSPRRRGSGT